jgi:Co/Zn/Cd efflux system component
MTKAKKKSLNPAKKERRRRSVAQWIFIFLSVVLILSMIAGSLAILVDSF